MGGRYPTDAPWPSLIGPQTVAGNLLTTALAAVPGRKIVTDWKVGPLTTWAATTTATGQKIRTSAADTGPEDAALILPGTAEWQAALYDASLTTQPQTQGWTQHAGAYTATFGNSIMRLQSSAGGFSWWEVPTGLAANSKLIIFHWRWGRLAAHATQQAVWLSVPYSGQNESIWRLHGTSEATPGGVFNQTLGGYVPGLTMAVGDIWDAYVAIRLDGTTVLNTEFLSRRAGAYGGTLLGYNTLDGVASYGMFAGITAGAGTDIVYIGDTYGSGTTDCYWGGIRWSGLPSSCDKYGWETLTNPDSTFTRPQQTYCQIDLGSNGTYTDMTLAGVANTTAFGYGTPLVALTTSDPTIAPGETSALGVTITGTADVTLDGVAKASGSSTINVTGVSAGLLSPPTIGAAPTFVNGVLMFNKPTAGTSTLTGGSFKVLTAAYASGPFTVASSTSWAAITWDSNNQVSASSLGVTVSPTAWYGQRIVDSANLSADGPTAVYGGDTTNGTCLVTFSGLTAGDTVSCRLSDSVTVEGVLYAQAPYSAVVGVGGTASLTLPRCDIGTASESTGIVFGAFTGASPAAWSLNRRIPDASTATFTSLAAP